MESMGFHTFEQFRDATSWLRPFCKAYNKLAVLVGRRVVGSHTFWYDNYDGESYIKGCDQTKCHGFNFKKMV